MSKVSKLSENRSGAGVSISGQSMDRVVEKRMPLIHKVAYSVLGLLVLLVCW